MFTQTYSGRVIEPAYRNWKTLYAEDAAAVHKAHLVGLARRGIVSAEIARTLARAMDAMERDFAFPEAIPPGVEDLYFVYERELGARVGPENAAWLHTARSRNDMDTTVFRMALKRSLLAFARRGLSLLEALASRVGSDEFVVLYTHGQPANASTLGHYLSAYACELADDLSGLLGAVEAVDLSTMGACAITGTGFPLDRELVARLLGFRGFVVNTYQAISTSHWLTKPAGAVEDIMVGLTRLMADMSHKASCEVGMLTFPDTLVQISSIMPQKRNPVILEHVRIQAGQAAGACASIRALYRNVPYQDVNEAADAPAAELMAALGTAASAVELAEDIARNVGTDQAAARRVCLAFGVTSTELADSLVRESGVGFRTAHEAASRFARSGNDVAELRKAFSEISGRPFPFTDEDVAEVLEPARFIQVRKTPGGPAPEGMAPVLARLAGAVDGLRAALDAYDDQAAKASAELAAAWEALRR